MTREKELTLEQVELPREERKETEERAEGVDGEGAQWLVDFHLNFEFDRKLSVFV